MKELFARFARKNSFLSGHPLAFALAVAVIVVWAVTGPIFRFSDTWQLVINTGTTIVTFLMVFLIQNSQNRESLATQLKLDELLRAVERASDRMINLEERPESDLEAMQERMRERSKEAIGTGEDEELLTASQRKAGDYVHVSSVEAAHGAGG